ncbi:tetraspanin-8-like [Solanum dulcamara]|uniref:tetraspanin-8-like n=1 Tax=Solanum dulcamara TaxID=45834 RepID=UPI002485CABF|nr:tetraspanin-8-like [Solanum dulcamara]
MKKKNYDILLLYVLLILGLPVLVVSVLALAGPLYGGVTFIGWIWMISIILEILGMLCLSIIGVLVTDKNTSRPLFGRDGKYSYYLLHKYVLNAENWEQIKRCLVDFKFCQPTNVGIGGGDIFKYIFYHIHLSCCKPPTPCGLEFHNATYWTMPKAGPAVADDDCKIWSNVQSELCFNCQSCTRAFLHKLHKDWKVYSIVYFVALLVFNFVGCVYYCVLMRKNRSKGYER